MTLEQFTQMVQFKDRETELHKYFDEHLVLHNLLYTNFSDIYINLEEDSVGAYYLISPVNPKSDISHMESFYNNITTNCFFKQFTVHAKLRDDKTIIIRLIKKDMA